MPTHPIPWGLVALWHPVAPSLHGTLVVPALLPGLAALPFPTSLSLLWVPGAREIQWIP